MFIYFYTKGGHMLKKRKAQGLSITTIIVAVIGLGLIIYILFNRFRKPKIDFN